MANEGYIQICGTIENLNCGRVPSVFIIDRKFNEPADPSPSRLPKSPKAA